jgi:ubiquinol-cytochrome c reductase iron-sulfur subunit
LGVVDACLGRFHRLQLGKGFGIVTTASSADHPTRRDFLFVATGAVAAVGAAATVWPLVSQMNPDASTIAAGAPI